KTINIFNEDSKFLIWRKNSDPDPIGWSILKGMDLETREQYIKAIGDDNIISVPITDDDEVYDALVTVTTMNEQQNKSYYTAKNFTECCLKPNQKVSMMFEL